MNFSKETLQRPDLDRMDDTDIQHLIDEIHQIVDDIQEQLIDPPPDRLGDTRWAELARLSQTRYRRTVARAQEVLAARRRRERSSKIDDLNRLFMDVAKEQLDEQDFKEMLEEARDRLG